jgi:hypothetical protein
VLGPVRPVGELGPVRDVEDAARPLGAVQVPRNLQDERDEVAGEDGGSRERVPQAPRREGEHEVEDGGERNRYEDQPHRFQRLHQGIAETGADPRERADDHHGAHPVARTAHPGCRAGGRIDASDGGEEHDLPRRVGLGREQNCDLDRRESENAGGEEQHGEYRRTCTAPRAPVSRRAARHLERCLRHRYCRPNGTSKTAKRQLRPPCTGDLGPLSAGGAARTVSASDGMSGAQGRSAETGAGPITGASAVPGLGEEPRSEARESRRSLTTLRSAWPFTGREDQLPWGTAACRDRSCCAVVLSGAPGCR